MYPSLPDDYAAYCEALKGAVSPMSFSQFVSMQVGRAGSSSFLPHRAPKLAPSLLFDVAEEGEEQPASV